MKIMEIKALNSIANRFVGKNSTLRFAERLQEVKMPVIACLKGYYKNAGDKLADIKMDKLRTRQSTSVVDHNLEEYNRLPDAIKNSLKPSDVYTNGHISQSRVNELWETAKQSGKANVYGRPPYFRGAPEDLDPQALETTGLMDVDSTCGVLDDFGVSGADVDVLGGVSDVIDVSDIADVADVADVAGGALDGLEIIGDIIDVLG